MSYNGIDVTQTTGADLAREPDGVSTSRAHSSLSIREGGEEQQPVATVQRNPSTSSLVRSPRRRRRSSAAGSSRSRSRALGGGGHFRCTNRKTDSGRSTVAEEVWGSGQNTGRAAELGSSPPPTTDLEAAGRNENFGFEAHDEMTEDERLRNLDVVFRFVNVVDGESKQQCGPSYEAFSVFDPSPEALGQLTLFHEFISPSDFEGILDALNAIILRYRTLSKRWLMLLIFLSFGALFISIFAHYAVGISLQMFWLIGHACAQSYLRRACPELLNEFLGEEVNPSLFESRVIFCRVQFYNSGCGSGFIEWDICQRYEELRAGALEEHNEQAQLSPLRSITAGSPADDYDAEAIAETSAGGSGGSRHQSARHHGGARASSVNPLAAAHGDPHTTVAQWHPEPPDASELTGVGAAVVLEREEPSPGLIIHQGGYEEEPVVGVVCEPRHPRP